jgi:uncharacterized protein
MTQLFDFIRLFGRFEYLLKTRGFLYPPPKPGHDAKADWDAFVASIRGRLAQDRDPAFRAAVGYLYAHPPYRQIAYGGNDFAWERAGDEGDFFETRLVRVLRRVRNNLFHGEPGASGCDTAGDPALIEHALTALRHVISASEALRAGLAQLESAPPTGGATTPALVSFRDTHPAPEYDRPQPERLVRGNPLRTTWAHHTNASGEFSCGVWASQSGAWHIAFADHQEEYFHVLAGRIRITTPDGSAREFRPGDACIIPAGFEGTFEVMEPARKQYVLFDRRA